MFSKIIYPLTLIILGTVIGLCIKVYIIRGIPATNAGGEIIILLALPCAIYAGYQFKRMEAAKIEVNDSGGKQ